ncbi:MAG: hypothetical protein HY671_07535 [Chloroflexi bacterium]|nr:hypothetical protein [Chloroflexota bacterium]
MAEEQEKEQTAPAEAGESGDGEASTLRQTLAERENRLKELEATLESRVGDIERRDAELTKLREGLATGATKYRLLLLSGSPEVPEEMVKGDTVEEVEASFAAATQMVERVKKGIEVRQRNERVPAGAPPRSPADLSAMSAQEKIAYGLARRDVGDGR